MDWELCSNNEIHVQIMGWMQDFRKRGLFWRVLSKNTLKSYIFTKICIKTKKLALWHVFLHYLRLLLETTYVMVKKAENSSIFTSSIISLISLANRKWIQCFVTWKLCGKQSSHIAAILVRSHGISHLTENFSHDVSCDHIKQRSAILDPAFRDKFKCLSFHKASLNRMGVLVGKAFFQFCV